VTGLAKVELKASAVAQACQLLPAKHTDLWGTDLRFVCPVEISKPGLAFRYPITIELNMDNGESVTSAGEIGGIWGTSFDGYVPVLPMHFAAAAATNSSVRDLLSDHVAFKIDYDAGISATTPLSGLLMGEVLLAGQTEMAGKLIPYTIAAPFAIQNGRFIRWSLTRAALNQMLADIGRSALARRIINSVSAVTLNMVYAEDDAQLAPDWLPTHWDSSTGFYREERAACLSDDAIDVPRPNHPLRGFNFNGGQGLWARPLEFLLIDARVVVNDLWLDDYHGERQGVRRLLIPKNLDTGDAPPFKSIVLMQAIKDYRPLLKINLPDTVSPEAQVVYDKIADSLPVPLDKQTWEAEGLTVVVNAAGELELAACR
jgi:hypothetical protein